MSRPSAAGPADGLYFTDLFVLRTTIRACRSKNWLVTHRDVLEHGELTLAIHRRAVVPSRWRWH
ncbi:hypothetical protein JNB91_30300 [Rhizobium wenxiniae]|nr:hypothetical protein [Rhizobium wenxiniae]